MEHFDIYFCQTIKYNRIDDCNDWGYIQTFIFVQIRVRVMVFNATLNTISVISRLSVL